jgi:hypothetical protein
MLRFASALLLVLSAVPANAQSTLMPATDVAKAMQGLVGQKFDGGFTIAAVTAENNTLVFLFDGPPQWRQTVSAEAITAAFVNGFCEKSTHFFSDGFALRVDAKEQGASDVRQGAVVDHCP